MITLPRLVAMSALMLGMLLIASGCGEESPTAQEPDIPAVQAGTVDLSGVSVEMHQEPG
jgi:hypothetical protein